MQDWKTKPLQRIIYKKDYKLSLFYNRFSELNIEKNKLNNIISYDSDLRDIFITIEHLILRLNDDIKKLDRNYELFLKLRNDSITKEEEREMFSLEIYAKYFKIDIKTLFNQISIFMDKIARYLGVLFHNVRPECSNYFHFKNSINNFKGKGIDKLIRLINAYSVMYKEIKDIRDDYIIHLSKETFTSITRSNNYISVSLSTRQSGKPQYISVSNESIDVLILQLKSYLKDLNDYLCNNIKEIPFKIKK